VARGDAAAEVGAHGVNELNYPTEYFVIHLEHRRLHEELQLLDERQTGAGLLHEDMRVEEVLVASKSTDSALGNGRVVIVVLGVHHVGEQLA